MSNYIYTLYEWDTSNKHGKFNSIINAEEYLVARFGERRVKPDRSKTTGADYYFLFDQNNKMIKEWIIE